MIKIATLGPENSYSHILSQKISEDNNKIILCKTLNEVFEKVDNDKNIEGVVPIENLIHGSVRECLLGLLKYGVYITESYDFNIYHCLAAKGDKFNSIVSHPQALAQCSDFLKNFREQNLIETTSTSEAMNLAKKDSSLAAIGSIDSAKNEELKILYKNIGNNKHNITRFIRIKKNFENNDIKNEKTSLIILPKEDRPGLLFEILSIFKIKDINLTKIESIPTGEKIGEYLFYLEIEGSCNQLNLKQSFDFLSTLVDVKILGSYNVKKIDQ
ncbi:prephenate dehydratase [Candidatus Woesearchaeota archaeon]|nr:MAG: prephenate dehydratase [Candidatus Woesearchaeota archaeon]